MPQMNTCVLAFPNIIKGEVRIVDFSNKDKPPKEWSVRAAENYDIAHINLSMDGTMLAACSTNGTIIRVFDLEKREKIKELRRGKNPASITHLTISADNSMMACCSDTGTVHRWQLNADNTASAFNMLGVVSSFV